MENQSPKAMRNDQNKESTLELIHEIEQLISHAENDTLSYSVLEHARKLIFTIKDHSNNGVFRG